MKNIINFFDKLEDKIRGSLSKRPILYATITSVGMIFIWRGIWHTADEFPFLTGPISFVIGTIILLITGVFVSSFIGNRIILTGLKGEKKLTEMTKNEVEEIALEEETQMQNIEKTLAKIEKDIEEIKEKQ